MINKNIKINHLHLILSIIALLLFNACNSKVSKENTTIEIMNDTVNQKVLTTEERVSLTPDMILQQIKDGNLRFRSNNSTKRNHTLQIRQSAVGQYPKAVVLSCLDSRVPVEDVFDQGLGDVFVARIAGNFVNSDILGSMEFACKVAGAKLVLVMGHQHCGAIKGEIDKVKLGSLTALLEKINPAVKLTDNYKGEKKSTNENYVKQVAKNNVKLTIEKIRSNSPILKEMEDKGEIKIAGAFYTLTKGELIILD